MEVNPSVVVVSCSNTKPKSLIKLITKEPVINEDHTNGIIVQPWNIDTKYYTAKVNIIGINDKYERNENFNNNVEAIVVHMDTNKETGLDDLEKWSNLEQDCEPEVKLLIANYCTDDTKITKNTAIEWCSKRGYEFIELYPTINKNDVNEVEVIKEKFGVDRIVEALQTHAWSNLALKSNGKLTDKDKKSSNEIVTDEALDDFSELFSQLHMMKDSFQSLPTSQRKQCAEQMVTAFWKAMGGEEEEILDL